MNEPAYMTYLRVLLQGICDFTDQISIERKVDEMGVLISLRVDPRDMGKVVGRQGANAKSIRTLLHAAGRRDNALVSLKILEPDGSEIRQKIQEA